VAGSLERQGSLAARRNASIATGDEFAVVRRTRTVKSVPEVAGYEDKTIGNRLGAEQACRVV
jgi:hypothetical protein